ncbi:MAG: hypothetical protein P1U74_01780 [Legionellaceae bacterium]|nr:hypothetical protein [Legionellaceae bacterium]
MNSILCKFKNYNMYIKNFYNVFSHVIISICFWLGLTYPWIQLKIQGLSQIGFNEESIGYRYFHTLRILYGQGEYPWLPQGHLTGLFHMLIQLTLTALGYPISDRNIRVEAFVDTAILVQSTLIALTFLFTFSIIRQTSIRLAAVALFLIASYAQSSFNWGLHLLTPDYFAWFLIPVCILVYALVKIFNIQRDISWGDYIVLGVVSGLCASIKVTYLIVPFTIWLAIAVNTKGWHSCILRTIVASLISVSMIVLILMIYYKFNTKVVVIHVERLFNYMKSAGDTQQAWQWLTSEIFIWPVKFITVSMLLPLLYLLGTFFSKKNRIICAILFIGTALETAIGWIRFNGDTSIETNAFAAGSIIIFFLLVFHPWLELCLKRFKKQGLNFTLSSQLLGGMSVIALIGISYSEMNILISKVFSPIAMTADSGRKLEVFRREHSGMTLFLTPNNALRPLTIDSSIYKGATDVTDARWDQSPLMKRLFPDRWYIHGAELYGSNNTPNFNLFQTIVYSYFPNVQDPTFNEFKARYDINTNNFICSFNELTGNGATLVGCFRSQIS